MLAGVKNSLDTAHDLGITTLNDESRYGPALVLGGGEVLLLDHVSAFGTFANQGVHKPPQGILKIIDGEGKTLEEFQEKSGQQVLDPQIAYLINSILSDNAARSFIFSSRNFLTLPDRPVAAKTGTTQEFHDAWTVGYTPQLATGVWVGNNDNGAMKKGADGGVVAAPIWNSFMKKALTGKPVLPFARPGGVEEVVVDAISGLLPNQYTPTTKTEVFASFALPQKYDDLHTLLKIDKTTGAVASDETLPTNIIEKIFTIFHSEKPEDPAWEQPVRDWAVANNFPYPTGYFNNDMPTSHPIYISLQQPTEGQIITSLPLTIEALASSKSKIKKLTIFLDGKEIFSDSTPSLKFFYSSSISTGEHLLQIQAETENGDKNMISRKIVYELTGN